MGNTRKVKVGGRGRGAAKLFSGEKLTNLISLVREVGTVNAALKALTSEDGPEAEMREKHGFDEPVSVVYQTVLRTVMDYNEANPKDAVVLAKGARQKYAKDANGKDIWVSAEEAKRRFGHDIPADEEWHVQVSDIANEKAGIKASKPRKGRKAA